MFKEKILLRYRDVINFKMRHSFREIVDVMMIAHSWLLKGEYS